MCDDGKGIIKDCGEVLVLMGKKFKFTNGVAIEIKTNDRLFFSVIFENSILYEKALNLKVGDRIVFKGAYDNSYFNIFDLQ